MTTVAIPAERVRRYDVPGPRYTSYPTVPAWKAPFGAAEYRAALARLAEREEDPVSVYVHLPFCSYRCHYCGCNVSVTSRAAVVDEYLDRLEREFEMVTSLIGPRRRVLQLHLGGGTPNLLTVPQLCRLYDVIERRFDLATWSEQSVEADPRHVSAGQLQALRGLGFRRISFGVQDFDPAVQEAIGRLQPEALVRDAVALAREAEFEGINFDLVYGLPRQTVATFSGTLERAIALGPDRVACYSYAHVPQVRHNQRLIPEADLPAAAVKFELFRLAVDRFTGAGYEWVGMDHFARPDDELARAARDRRLHRDFMGYTTRPAPHLLAFGMSAISDVAGAFVQNVPRTGEYQRLLDEGTLPVEKGHVLSEDDRRRRRAILHLMCNLELPYDLVPEPAELVRRRMLELAADGLVEIEADRWAVTPLGRFFLRNVAMPLDAYLPAQLAEPRPVFSRTV